MFLKKLEKFLVSVDLASYRKRYLPIKIVEMDLPKSIQAISLLYEVYWDRKEFLPFESFYEEYRHQHKKALEEFRKKTQMCSKCFYKGLPARIYRTWASIVTQIHAGYVAESVFGDGSTSMSAELDNKGADFQISYKGRILNYQVKKETQSREVRREKKVKESIPGEFINIEYKVPNYERIKNPNRKDGNGLYKEYKDFKENFLDPGYLRIFSNGFVVFTSHIFEEKKRQIDKGSK
ncbi:MAG: TaqI family restriction endonuclease [bacterium]|nr:TaqI family restriction endonuclease [bacterium]